MSHQVFISNSFSDKSVAWSVCRDIEKHGVKCWVGPRNVNQRLSWTEDVTNAIQQSTIFLIVLSKESIKDHFTIQELRKAYEMNKVIIPFLIEDLQLSGRICDFLSSIKILDGTGQSLDKSIQRLSRKVLLTLKKHGDFHKTEEGSQEAPSTELFPQQNRSEKNLVKAVNYDVFISYRRSTDSQTARLIRSELQNRGYKVFLDVDDLKPGHFDEALIGLITETDNFVLILSKGALDRCSNPDDWLRKEVLCAIANKKNIIPIMMPGFIFPKPDEISPELRPLLVHHSINYSHDFFSAMVDKLDSFLE